METFKFKKHFMIQFWNKKLVKLTSFIMLNKQQNKTNNLLKMNLIV